MLSMFSHLYFKCWPTRGRLLNSQNGYQKLYINIVRQSQRKMELEKNHFWECQCLGIHIARALTAPSLTLSTKIHVHFIVIQAAPLTTFRDMYLHVIVLKKNYFIIFCIKFTIYKKIQNFQKNSYKNLFFIFFLYNT